MGHKQAQEDSVGKGRAVKGVTGKQKNPKRDAYKIICQSLLQRSPAKRLVLVSLMERSLARASTVQCGSYPSSQKIHEYLHHPENLWSERFSEDPEIRLFRPDETALSGKLRMEHIDELIAFGFELLGMHSSQFDGYYIDVDFPLWLTCHRFYFEFV